MAIASEVETTTGPTVFDGAALLAAVADDLVLATVRDTHRALADRLHGAVNLVAGPAGAPVEAMHRSIAATVYAGLGLAFRGAGRGLDRVADLGVGPRLEADPRGRWVSAVVNGLIGDELDAERPRHAIRMAVRRDGRDVAPAAYSLARAFPAATGDVVVLLHGLCEDESVWNLGRERVGSTYAEALAAQGWTPVHLRANTGLGIRPNGAALSSLLEKVVRHWPVEVRRIALIGHSLGGLIHRAATATVMPDSGPPERRWAELVTDVVTLGTPHRGAGLAVGADHGSRLLALARETAAFGRILDRRSAGIRDLVHGLDENVPPLPHARYRLVSATLTGSRDHPVGRYVGDLLVTPESAVGRDRYGRELFPDADTLHVGRTDHFGLLNHSAVHTALEEWLA